MQTPAHNVEGTGRQQGTHKEVDLGRLLPRMLFKCFEAERNRCSGREVKLRGE